MLLSIIIPIFKKPRLNSPCFYKKYYKKLLYLGLIFCIIPFWAGDYFHMKADFLNAKQGVQSNWEVLYQYLSTMSLSYYTFRLVLWGGSLFLLHKAFVIFFKVDTMLFMYILLYFFAMCLTNFSYLRASTCMSMIFLGLTIILINNDGIIKFNLQTILSICLIGASIFFHKSSLFAITMAIGVILTTYVKKAKLIILLFIAALPVLIGYANTMIEELLIFDPLEDNYLNMGAAQGYFNGELEKEGAGLGMFVQDILTRSQYYIFVILYIISIYKGAFELTPKYVQCFAHFAFFTILIANITLYALAISASVLYYRILYYSMLPAIVFFAYCMRYEIYPKLCKISFYIAILGTLYTLIYSTYNRI